MTYKNPLIKKTLKSDILKKLSVSNKKKELQKIFNDCLEAYKENDDLSPENGYLLTVATLISRNRLSDEILDTYYETFGDVFNDLLKMVGDLHLNESEMLKWIPEIFNECNYVYHYENTHKFFSKVFTNDTYQEYLRKIEPIMFSWDEWFGVIKKFKSSAEAEAALIRQFSSDSHLERFQGFIYDTEWRMHFLQEVLEYCEKNDMPSVKHHCWKIIASEAVFGMNAEWLVNQYGYDNFFGPNKGLFEKEFLDNAISALNAGYEKEYMWRRAWEIDFDFDKFTQSENLRTFLKKRKSLRTQDILDGIENKTNNKWELMYRLGEVFKKDPELIKDNDKIWEFFINLPQSIFKELEEGTISKDNWSDKVNYLESLDNWKDAVPKFKKLHSAKPSEEQLLVKLLDYLSKADVRYSDVIDRLEEIGFENFNAAIQAEFRDHFVNGNWRNICEPFQVYFPSEHSDDGFYNDKEEWISFSKWSGADEW